VISSIEIRRFRGIRRGKLENLTPLTILVGPNGCGKSSVLDALLIGASENPQDAMQRVVQRHPGVTGGTRWFMWRAKTADPALVQVTTDAGATRKCKLELPGPTSLSCRAVDPGKVTFEGVKEIRLLGPHGFGKQVPLYELYAQTVQQGRRNDANAIIGHVVPGMDHLEILTEGDTPVLHLVYEDHSVPVALSGDGVHALVRQCLELASRPEGVVLFEEPEVHQHPGAIWQTARAILAAVRRDIQVILSTHSLEMIDAVVAESSEEDVAKLSLYRLELENGKLITVRHEGSEVEFSRCQVEKDLR